MLQKTMRQIQLIFGRVGGLGVSRSRVGGLGVGRSRVGRLGVGWGGVGWSSWSGVSRLGVGWGGAGWSSWSGVSRLGVGWGRVGWTRIGGLGVGRFVFRFGFSLVLDIGNVTGVVIGFEVDGLGASVGQKNAVRSAHVALVVSRLLVGEVVLRVVILDSERKVVRHRNLFVF